MALTPTRAYLGQPGTTDGTLYTVSSSAGSYFIVKEILVVNTSASAATISLALNGTAATAANCAWADAYPVAANSSVVFALSTVLNASDTIHGLQGTSGALTVTVSGVAGP